MSLKNNVNRIILEYICAECCISKSHMILETMGFYYG